MVFVAGSPRTAVLFKLTGMFSLNEQSELQIHHSPPELSVSVESVVHNTVEAFDEAVKVLHLLSHVLVALQSLVVLPKRGTHTRAKKERGSVALQCRGSIGSSKSVHIQHFREEYVSVTHCPLK